jgi:TolC family type I secretion outer membrane protein
MRQRRGLSRAAIGVVTAISLFAFCGAAVAESLNDSLASAYETNPTLRQERARQRATDETVPQALSGWRPQVQLQGELGWEHLHTRNVPTADEGLVETIDGTNPASIAIGLSQPVFRGFKTVEGTKQAQATVQAGRQDLLAVEQQVLFDGVQAYMDVWRNRRVVALRQKNVQVLQEQLRAAQERFDVGEVTRTDVEQARARYSLSQSTLASARADLAASIAFYTRVIGHAPGTLNYPKIAKLPKQVDEAIAIASETNPQILAASFVEEAAQHSIKVARGDLLPELNLEAQGIYADDDLSDGKSITTEMYTVGAVLTVPLYEAGLVYSQVRQAKQIASQRRIQVIEVARAVREVVVTAWSSLEAARQVIVASRAQVSANVLALEGVRQEYLVGSRTTLDVLDAEAELVESQVLLADAERAQIIAAYQLVASIGRLTARSLALNVEYYDPIENYRDVRDKWIGTGVQRVE